MVWLVDFSRRRAGWVLIGAILLSAVSLNYTVTHLYLDTDTKKNVGSQSSLSTARLGS